MTVRPDDLATLADIVDILEDHGIEVQSARSVQGDVGGDLVRGELTVAAPTDRELTENPDSDTEDEPEDSDPLEDDGAEDVSEATLRKGTGTELDRATKPWPDVLPTFEDPTPAGTEGSEDDDVTAGRSVQEALASTPDDDEAISSKPEVEAWLAGQLTTGPIEITTDDVPDHVDATPTWIGRSFNQLGEHDAAPLDVEREHEDDPTKSTIYTITPHQTPPVVDDGENDLPEDEPEGGSKWWCGYCSAGPFITKDDVEDHHDREHHPGDPVPVDEEPATDDVDEDDQEETTDADSDPASEQRATSDGGIQIETYNGSPGGPSRTCQNCGSHVTAAYARVWTPEDEPGPRVCPDCPDMIRDGEGGVRPRRDGGQHTEGDDA